MSDYQPDLATLTADPSVIAEFQQLAGVIKSIKAQLNTLGGTQAASDASPLAPEVGLVTGKEINTLPLDAAGKLDTTRRWLNGPWLLNADGNKAGDAVIRPPQITSNQDNYAPLGIDGCIGMELNSTTDVTITGIRVAAVQRRIQFILNTGLFNLIFPNERSTSVAQNRIGLGSGSDALTLPPGRVVWFYYDAWASRWRLFALPAVPSADLPASVQPVIPVTAFPPAYGWFGTRADGTSGILSGIGEADTALSGTYRNDPQGIGRDVTTAASSGSATGVATGGGQQVSPQHDPTWEVLIRTGPAITNLRLWIVLTTGNPTDADAIGGSNAYLGFRYSTVVPDAGWVGVMCDGTTQTLATGVGNITTDTIYKLKVRKHGSAIDYSVNDGPAVTLTSPGGAFETKKFFWNLRWFTQDNVAKTISFYQHMVRFGISF